MSRSVCHSGFSSAHLNVAVGLLEQVAHVEMVIGQFRQHGLDLACCRLVTTRESGHFDAGLAAQLDHQIRVVRVALKSLVAEHIWADVILAAGAAGDGVASRHADLVGHMPGPPALMRQNDRLIRHLQSGGGVLVVALEDHLQQQVVAGLLLKLASAVFTHQMGARAKGVAPCPAAIAPKVAERIGDSALHGSRPAN